jgi:hypothetical protein
MKYLFIGEQRSSRAIKMNVRLEDGRLAAKQLFDALDHCKISRTHCKFINLFESLEEQNISLTHHDVYLVMAQSDGFQLVGMGEKVSKELNSRGFHHIKIIHPAARGKIRKKERYFAHIQNQLGYEDNTYISTIRC